MLNGRHVVLAQTGIGNGERCHYHHADAGAFHAAEVIFTGIAGGVNPKLSPGDLVIGSRVAYHDYGAITPDSMVRQPTKSHDSQMFNPTFF